MVEPRTLADRIIVRRFPESAERLLKYELPTKKLAIQYILAQRGGLELDSSISLAERPVGLSVLFASGILLRQQATWQAHIQTGTAQTN